MSEDLHEMAARQLRAARQRYTNGRRALVSLLASVGKPITISAILELEADLSQSSVYRNLQVLEQAGVVRRLVTPSDSGALYELDEDLTHHHHHLVCRVCGDVEDFHVMPELEEAFETLSARVGSERRFKPEHHRLELVGTCSQCG